MTPVLVLNVGSSSSTGWTAATGCSPPVSWSGSGHGLDALDVAEWTWLAQTPSEGRRAYPHQRTWGTVVRERGRR